MKILDFIERNKFSVFGTILVHLIIFIWSNWTVVETAVPKQQEEEVIAVLDFSKEEVEESEELDPNTPIDQQTTGEMQNVAANVNQEKTTYTNNFSKSQADQEVWEELKQMEAAEFSNLQKDNPSLIEKNSQDENNSNPNLVKEGAEKNEKAGYGMDVVATVYYELKNRNVLTEKKPSYLCKNEGIVRVNIKVNQKGQVVTATIDESKTNTQNECLRNAAIEYAELWKFNQDFNDQIRKQGWIEFRYAAQ